MPRKKTVTDEAVLDAALKAMFRSGPADFTLADVGREAGVAPSTLLQRFGSKRRLVLRAIERDNALFAATIRTASSAAGAESVIALFMLLTPDLGPDDSLTDEMLWLREDFSDPALNALARDRLRTLRAAVTARLPPLKTPPAVGARLLEAQWQGARTQWGFFREGRLSDYVRRALRDWFALAGAQ